ncbi:MAG: N-acetylmuramoyl-L-alanine amidase [Clostridia bacterium]|nr:N-acetylmuramoyl-L-alanine amidase [Clostridia bacterium]
MKKRLITAAVAALVVVASVLAAFLIKYSSQQTMLQSAGTEVSGGIIKSIEPSDVILASENEKITFEVVAKSGSKVQLKMGAKKYEMKKGKEQGGYCEYKVSVKMPKSKIEIDTIGRIFAIAVYDSASYSLEGAQVVYSKEKEEKTTRFETLPAENNASEVVEFTVGTIQAPSFNYSTTAPHSVTQYVEYTGNQMCVVTDECADVWPLGNSCDYVPFYTPLIKGTTDYITGEISLYDSEEDETREFYILSSSRKIQKKSVSVFPKTDFGDNTITASSVCQNGELKIFLNEKWKVPYSFSATPVDYYKAHGKSYNVSSFSATAITFSFYHTVSAVGNLDVSGSDVVSSASWSLNQASKTAMLTLSLKTAGEYYGYSAEYDSSGNLIITIRNKPPQSLSSSVIMLDAGHGGTDSGAVGFSGGVYESNVNLALCSYLTQELQRRGATVYLTRTTDKKVTLEERKSMARAVKPDVFVSIHSDGSENKSVFGTSAYYFRPMSKELAENIYSNMLSAYSSFVYPGNSQKLSNASRGCKYHPFSVTRIEDCPSVLIELGYVTNDEECRKLIDTQVAQQLAVAIANGIEGYLR